MKLPSSANQRQHWRAKAAQVAKQRHAMKLGFEGRFKRQGVLECIAELTRGGVLRVVLTRISPRKLDSDNLQSAFKAVRDEIAARLGTDDGSDQWDWEYRQQRGPHSVQIEISRLGVSDTGLIPLSALGLRISDES